MASEEASAGAGWLTPEWLTTVLRRAGVLERGEVVAVDLARLPHLAPTYSAAASADAPAHLFLKGDRTGNVSLEVAAYRALAAHRAELPMLLRCYDAASGDADGGAARLLLDDFSATHRPPVFPVPAPDDRAAITDCTAQFHARWWEEARRDLFPLRDPNTGLDYRDGGAFAAYAARYREAYPYFADFAGDRLSSERRASYETLLAALPALWDRYLAGRFAACRAITLVQGDSHWGQFACARGSAGPATIMLDLECLHWGLPAFDLAYRITLDWLPEVRRALEPAIIARYLDGLRRRGVGNYDERLFWQDYRLSTALLALYPLKRFTAQFPERADRGRAARSLPAWWWGVLEHILVNYRDLGCAELLG